MEHLKGILHTSLYNGKDVFMVNIDCYSASCLFLAVEVYFWHT